MVWESDGDQNCCLAVECSSEERGPVVWVSNAQLYVDYVLQTGHAGPIKKDGWKDSEDFPMHALLQIGFKERTRWFGKVLREILRHADVPVMAGYCRRKAI